MIIDSYKEEDTFSFGEELGKKVVPGEIYALCGDLGVGKTVFTKGLAKGLGITESVCSPTFTIVQIYEEGRLPLYHFDVYRIGDPEEMDEIGYYEAIDGDSRPWSSVTVNAPGAATHTGMVYAIQNPFTGVLLYPSNGRHWSLGQDQMFEIMSQWGEYELREIDDVQKRASICGVSEE